MEEGSVAGEGFEFSRGSESLVSRLSIPNTCGDRESLFKCLFSDQNQGPPLGRLVVPPSSIPVGVVLLVVRNELALLARGEHRAGRRLVATAAASAAATRSVAHQASCGRVRVLADCGGFRWIRGWRCGVSSCQGGEGGSGISFLLSGRWLRKVNRKVGRAVVWRWFQVRTTWFKSLCNSQLERRLEDCFRNPRIWWRLIEPGSCSSSFDRVLYSVFAGIWSVLKVAEVAMAGAGAEMMSQLRKEES